MPGNLQKTLLTIAVVCCTSIFMLQPAVGSIVSYTGTGAAAGLGATAHFKLINGGTGLEILLTNTSNGGLGGSNQVLSSLNFGLPMAITGGSAVLPVGSNVVHANGSAWGSAGYTGNINTEYGYSNLGVGNSTGGAILSGVSAGDLSSLKSSVTSHSNGGKKVNKFSGGTGLPGGLDFGLVAGQNPFGKRMFVKDSILLRLNLAGILTDLSFLTNGSYVEFGSDYAYVGRSSGAVPEPGSILVWSVLFGGMGLVLCGRRRQPVE